MPGSLSIWLASRRVGTITNLPGDYNLFTFDEAYLADDQRPVLSQAFIDAGGTPIRTVPRVHRLAPPFFSNLLPEEDTFLRKVIARQRDIKATRDFPYLRILGEDLPGAVLAHQISVEDDEGADVSLHLTATERPLRFSLAGVQPKFSGTFVGDRLTIPLTGPGGRWIAKLPTNTFQRLPENEFTIMSFARAIGLAVPEIQLVNLDLIEGIPQELPALRLDEPRLAYVISRFDRLADHRRVHVEDFNQIANQMPVDKYDNKASHWIAKVISVICPEDIDDFVRRLVFGVCIGNNDMHLKNWAIMYPDGRHARLSPLYDFVCTRYYYPAGDLALTIGGERSFERIGLGAMARFARVAELSPRRVDIIVKETVAAINDIWPRLKADIADVELVRALDKHFSEVPLMTLRD